MIGNVILWDFYGGLQFNHSRNITSAAGCQTVRFPFRLCRTLRTDWDRLRHHIASISITVAKPCHGRAPEPSTTGAKWGTVACEYAGFPAPRPRTSHRRHVAR